MRRQTILSITILLLFCKQFSIAATIKELPATPETEIIQASILLNEISYKNSSADFISFKIKSDLTQVDLKGLSFYSDKIFKTIDTNFVVKNNDLITLTFNSDQEDSEIEHKLYTANSGLTSTTEQIAILKGSHYFDFFCWYQDPVSKSELTEFPTISSAASWPSTEINSCFPSKSLKKDQNLVRIKTGQTLDAWQIAGNTENEDSESETETRSNPIEINTANFADQDFADNQELISSATDQKKSISEYTDSPVIINEIYPVPDKAEFEWVELFNRSEQTVDLAKWQIDDADGGSKPKPLGTLKLAPGTYSVINLKTLKINLNNSSDSVRLFNPSEELADQIDYEEATKKSSYQLQELDGEPQWRWNIVPSPGVSNPKLTTITGQITSPPQFDKIYHFDLVENSGENHQIKTLVIFDENLIKGPQAEKTFLPGHTGKFIGELIENTEQKNYQQVLKLYQFELDSSPESGENHSYLWGITGILGGTGSYFAYRKKSWINSLFGKF